MTNQPGEQLALHGAGMPESPELAPQASTQAQAAEEVPEPRFNPAQRRSFGSVPGLLSKNMEIPHRHELDDWAVERVEPATIKRGLLGREDGFAVNGVVLNSEEYTTIVRNPRSFSTAVQAKTVAANRILSNDVRREEKRLKSDKLSLEQKTARHATYITGLQTERELLTELLEWQRTPGYARTTQIDIVAYVHQAWSGSFTNMLAALKDQYGLTPEQHQNMTQAMNHRLFKGPQRDRIAYWGDMLGVACDYNRAKSILFTNRYNKILRKTGQLTVELEAHYNKYGIS